MLAAVHRLVAVPEVAGHPAGAAVDVRILRGGEPLDFGAKIHEFAPFDGEWWHFSYGDKEWARYYNRSAALYNQIDWQPTPIVG